MLAHWLTNAVILLHFSFVLFVLLGGLLCLKWRWVAWVHIPAVAWGVAIELAGWVCPLTPLENTLRRQAGLAGYDEGFIDHYVGVVLYPPGMTPVLQWMLAALLALFNLAVYWLVYRRYRRPPDVLGHR